MSDDDKIAKLPVRFKEPAAPDRVLARPHEVPGPLPCNHWGATYVIDESLAEVACSRCQAKLNPMWVLGQLASDDRRYQESRARYQEEMKRLSERSRTKCNNCGKMTKVSNR